VKISAHLPGKKLAQFNIPAEFTMGYHNQSWNWVTFCDPVSRESSDPETQLTLFYNELQMPTYVADKRLQWAGGLPVFIAVWPSVL